MKHQTMLYTRHYEPHEKVRTSYFYDEETGTYGCHDVEEIPPIYDNLIPGDMGHWGP